MLRAALLLSMLLVTTAAQAEDFRVGADLSVFLREEAGGNRTVLPGLSLRGSYRLRPSIELAGLWMQAFDPKGRGPAEASSWHQRFAARAEFALPIRTSSLVLAAGPGVSLTRTTLFGDGEAIASTTLARFGASGALLFEVNLPHLTLRTGVEAFRAARRTDVAVVLGGTWPSRRAW